jgi:hypothetical protein
MKDNEFRGIVLKHYYDKRYERGKQWSDEDILSMGHGLTKNVVLTICGQLADQNLIEWNPVKLMSGVVNGSGKITAYGVDIIEGEAKAPISILVTQGDTITVSQSSEIQIGNSNIQHVIIDVEKILSAINNSTAKDAEKEEAKSLLHSFLSHPLVSAIVGGLASKI